MKQDFYVYVLFTPWDGKPCYVGKGRGRRWRSHNRAGALHPNPRLAALFVEAEKRGAEIRRIKIRTGVNEDEAYAAEADLVRMIGRIDLNTGPLANATAGGGVVSHVVWQADQRQKMGGRMKLLWADPEWRRRQIERFREVGAAKRKPKVRKGKKVYTGADRAAFSLKAKQIWADPISRKRLMRFNTSPATRALRSQKAKERWANPEFKAKVRAALLKINQRRRQKELAT